MNRVGKPSEPINLTSLEYSLLASYCNKSTISVRMYKRLSIILKSADGELGINISDSLGLSNRVIYKWLRRWREGYGSLSDFSDSDELLSKMLGILGDKPRTGAPIRISLSEKESLVALACESPSDYGLPVTSWNRELLAQVAVRENLVKTISPSYVSKVLKKQGYSSS